MIPAGAVATLIIAGGDAAAAAEAAHGRTVLTPLTIDTCVDVDGKEVQRLIELQVNAPAGDSTGPVNAVRLDITCDGGGVAMQAWDPVSGQRARRSIPLHTTAHAARPRLLAISAVELAATVLAEAQARLAPEPGAAAATETVTTTAPPAAPGEWVWRLVAFGAGEWFPKLTHLEGGGLRLGFDGPIVGASVSVQATFGRDAITDGSAAIASMSLTPMASVHRTFERYTLRAGTGPRFGIGRMDGSFVAEPSRERVLLRPWIGWPLQLGIGVAITQSLVAEMTVEGGYVIAPLRGKFSGERVFNIEGVWIGASLSFGFRL